MSENNNDGNEEMGNSIFNVQNLKIFENDSDDIESLKQKNRDMQNLLSQAIKLLMEKNGACLNLEKHNKALNLQVGCLKDVIAITKNLLGIRNSEVEDMRSNMSSLQEKINAERERQNEMIKTVSNVNRINEDIRVEYHSQMTLFQHLKEKYNEKVALLAKENERLQSEVLKSNTLIDN